MTSDEIEEILKNDPDQGQYYVGVVFEKDDGLWYIDRWMRSDGPFDTKVEAETHKSRLAKAYETREKRELGISDDQ